MALVSFVDDAPRLELGDTEPLVALERLTDQPLLVDVSGGRERDDARVWLLAQFTTFEVE